MANEVPDDDFQRQLKVELAQARDAAKDEVENEMAERERRKDVAAAKSKLAAEQLAGFDKAAHEALYRIAGAVGRRISITKVAGVQDECELVGEFVDTDGAPIIRLQAQRLAPRARLLIDISRRGESVYHKMETIDIDQIDLGEGAAWLKKQIVAAVRECHNVPPE